MKFCLFTIVKNEHRFLDEWLIYHLNFGIDHIFVFEDIGSDSHSSICSKYNNVECNSVLSLYSSDTDRNSIIRDKENHVPRLQVRYMYKILSTLYDYDWVIYLDVDEFLTFQYNNSSLCNIFQQYCEYDNLVLQWMNFNANSHILRPIGSVIESYTKECDIHIGNWVYPFTCTKLAFNMHRWNRSIICNMHLPKNGRWCKTDFSSDITNIAYDKIYVRHYITKSFEDYCHKLYKNGQFVVMLRSILDFFDFNPDMSITDDRIQNILSNYSNEYRLSNMVVPMQIKMI